MQTATKEMSGAAQNMIDQDKENKSNVEEIGKRQKFDKDLLQVVKEAYDEVEDLKADRSAINDKIGAIFSDLEAKGFNKKAIKSAFQFINLDDNARENWDNSMLFVRQALDRPLQNDLFAANMNAALDKH